MKVRIKVRRAEKAAKRAKILAASRQDLPEFQAPPAAPLIPPQDVPFIIRELERLQWLRDPAIFIEERCHEFLWSKQKAICASVCANRRTAVHSCHETGKSFLAARLAAWWLCAHKPGEAFVVSSAPTGRQVRTILWREIGRIHAQARLPGRCNQTEWLMDMPAGNEEIVAFGMKPDDMSPTAFQGIHARYVLVIFDEACGIAQALWDAADSLVANDDSRMLAIGNPDDPETEFHEVCKPGSGWNVIGIGYLDTPNFTGEKVPAYLPALLIGPFWVEEKRRKWGELNPLFISKVMGQFPVVTIDGLISLKWIREAQSRELTPGLPHELGVDVGGGGNKSVTCERLGCHYRIVRRDSNPDTMATCGELIAMLIAAEETRVLGGSQITSAKVDEIGIGRGIVNRAAELKRHEVHGVNVGRRAKDHEHFENIRAEGYWDLREQFQNGLVDIDADDDDLAAQLADLKYKRSSHGKILMESKDQIKRRNNGRSPDDADAMMLASLDKDKIGNPEIQMHEALWG